MPLGRDVWCILSSLGVCVSAALLQSRVFYLLRFLQGLVVGDSQSPVQYVLVEADLLPDP